jgi:hypothetical protein
MLGEIASALGEKDVNLRAVHGGNEGGQGVVRMVVDTLATAKQALIAHGWQPEEEEILEVALADRPGALGEAAKLLGEAGVNIKYVFAGTSGSRRSTAFLGVSDLGKALEVLQ